MLIPSHFFVAAKRLHIEEHCFFISTSHFKNLDIIPLREVRLCPVQGNGFVYNYETKIKLLLQHVI